MLNNENRHEKRLLVLVISILTVNITVADSGSIELNTGIIEARQQYQLLLNIEKQVLTDAIKEKEIDHDGHFFLKPFTSYQAKYMVPPEKIDFEGTPAGINTERNIEIQKK